MTKRIAVAETRRLPDGRWILGRFIERTVESQADQTQNLDGDNFPPSFPAAQRIDVSKRRDR